LKPINLHPPFVHHLLRSTAFQEEFYRFGKGIVADLWSTNYSAMKNIGIPVMRLSEQAQIAKFLDYETLRIDALIEKQQQLIALLKEKRQAVISHAVTKGLNPDAPMRDSGVPWAPLVPAHWSLTPNRSVLRIRKKLVGRRHSSYRLLSLTKQGVLIRDVSTGEGKHSDHLDRCQEVRPGDLVFCLFDVEETPRTVGLSEHLGMISGDYTVFECADPLAGRFLEYFYKAMDDRKLLSFLYRGLRKRIPKPGFLGAKTPMPPSEEQEAIVRYLDEVGEQLAKLGDSASGQVELLQERRTALISAAVTGKIDVRGWQAPDSEAEAEVA
jgi:type I restriction enzyme S subunit